MLCPKCKTEMRLSNLRYVLEDGKLFTEQDVICRNKKCANNGNVVKTYRTQLEISETVHSDNTELVEIETIEK